MHDQNKTFCVILNNEVVRNMKQSLNDRKNRKWLVALAFYELQTLFIQLTLRNKVEQLRIHCSQWILDFKKYKRKKNIYIYWSYWLKDLDVAGSNN